MDGSQFLGPRSRSPSLVAPLRPPSRPPLPVPAPPLGSKCELTCWECSCCRWARRCSLSCPCTPCCCCWPAIGILCASIHWCTTWAVISPPVCSLRWRTNSVNCCTCGGDSCDRMPWIGGTGWGAGGRRAAGGMARSGERERGGGGDRTLKNESEEGESPAALETNEPARGRQTAGMKHTSEVSL